MNADLVVKTLAFICRQKSYAVSVWQYMHSSMNIHEKPNFFPLVLT